MARTDLIQRGQQLDSAHDLTVDRDGHACIESDLHVFRCVRSQFGRQSPQEHGLLWLEGRILEWTTFM